MLIFLVHVANAILVRDVGFFLETIVYWFQILYFQNQLWESVIPQAESRGVTLKFPQGNFFNLRKNESYCSIFAILYSLKYNFSYTITSFYY